MQFVRHAIILIAAVIAYPITLTNHAGRVVSGEFGGIANNAFIVNGKDYSLSVLPKSEILRVKKLAGCDVRTAKEKRLDHAWTMRLERIRVREAEGEIDKVTADRLLHGDCWSADFVDLHGLRTFHFSLFTFCSLLRPAAVLCYNSSHERAEAHQHLDI